MSKIFQFSYQISQTEFLLLEMQGSVTHTSEEKFNNMYLGKLEQINDNTFTFTIGNHQLIGKKVDLKNPIIVCQKERLAFNENNDQEVCLDANNTNIKVLKIIKSKIIFNSRPTPIQVININNNK